MLRGCLNKYELRDELRRLPENLGKVYQRMLENIPERRLPVAIRILQLLLFSSKPLTVTELSHAIAVEPNAEFYVDTTKFLHDSNDIALYCPGLTILVKQYEELILNLYGLSNLGIDMNPFYSCRISRLRNIYVQIRYGLVSKNLFRNKPQN